MYYVLITTNRKKKRVLATQSYQDSFNFIVANKGKVKIHTLSPDNVKPRVIDKRKFLESFYENTKDLGKLFTLCSSMIGGKNNQDDFIRSLKLTSQFRAFKKVVL